MVSGFIFKTPVYKILFYQTNISFVKLLWKRRYSVYQKKFEDDVMYLNPHKTDATFDLTQWTVT